MKQVEDNATLDMLLTGAKRRPGRPATGGLSAAERQRLRRERLKEQGKGFLTVSLSQELLSALDKFVQFKDETKEGAVERILRDRLLRKR